MQRRPRVRVDPVLLSAVAAVGGACLVVAPWPTTSVAVGATLLCLRRARVTALALALALFALGGFRARYAVDRFEAQWGRTRVALGEPRRCAALARVVSSPTRLLDRMTWAAELESADCEGHALPAGTRARLYGGPPDLGRGDRVELVAQLAPSRWFRNIGLPDPMPGAARRAVVLSGEALAVDVDQRGTGFGRVIDSARGFAHRRIDDTFAPAAAPLARALVLGENDLEPEDDLAFRRSGLAHLLAVSGTLLVLAVLTLVSALRAFLVRVETLACRFDMGRVAAGAGIPLALLYADFAGGSGSAWRAAWMLAVGLFARAAGRHPRPTRALALSLLIGVAYDPLAAFDISFLLSAAATTGLVVLGRPLAAPVKRLPYRALRWLGAAVATTVAAMTPCIPLLAMLSPDITIAGIAANVVAAPIGEMIALPLCLLHPLTASLPVLEKGTALVASGALIWVREVARTSAAARWLAVPVPDPGPWHLAVLAMVAIGLWVTAKRRKWLVLGLGLLALVEAGAARAGSPRDTLRVSVLDVGQGDSLLVDLPDGKLMLIDGGGFVGSPVDPGSSVVVPLLRARRRKRVDVMVISHPHPDHFTGLLSVLRAVEVGELWDTGEGEARGAGSTYAAILREARTRGVPIRRPAELCGAAAHGRGAVQVLAPCPGPVTGRGANDNSFVLRVALGRRAALLVGDAEREEERDLLLERATLRADLLKVGHHGSRTSSGTAFLGRVQPGLAVISCGARNRFGHPHAATIRALDERDVHTLRTDQVGGVTWSTDGDRVAVLTATTGP